ncbi:MAG: glycosyltransferase family 2 protein [bacterium]
MSLELKPKISLIIPAHNEELNIAKVLDVAVKSSLIDEIIVVADACTDHTAEVAQKYGVKVVEKPTTLGKGDAMITGVNASTGEVILFADADLTGFKLKHIEQILKPIIAHKAVMSVGLRDRVFGLGALIPKIFPLYAIGGERAMTKTFFDSIPKSKNTPDFGIESVMNYYIKKHRLPAAYPVLRGLHQIIKEKKWGFWTGFFSRLKLIWQICRTRITMRLKKY